MCETYFNDLFYPLQNPVPESHDEVEILRKFHHKGIVKYLTSFTNPRGSLCIVMEFCDYGSLTKKARVSAYKAFPFC